MPGEQTFRLFESEATTNFSEANKEIIDAILTILDDRHTRINKLNLAGEALINLSMRFSKLFMKFRDRLVG